MPPIRSNHRMKLTVAADKIDQERQHAVDRIIAGLHNLHAELLDGRNSCSFECDSIRLGALTKEMHSRALYFPRPGPPFLGFSVVDTTKVWLIRSLQCDSSNRVRYGARRCDLHASIGSIVGSVEDNVGGLRLEEFPWN